MFFFFIFISIKQEKNLLYNGIKSTWVCLERLENFDAGKKV